MDDYSRRRRQDPPVTSGTNSRYPVQDVSAQRRYAAAPIDNRYRPTPLNTSPTASRGMGGTTSYSGYYQEPTAAFSTAMPQSTIAYQAEYNQDNRQAQNYGAYNTSMLYNVPQPGTQAAVYDTSQQFQSRQPAGMQMMSADVTAPYFPGEPANAAAPASMQSQTGSSSASGVYQHSPADQRAMLQNYPGGMASMSNMAQSSAPDQVVEEQDYTASAEMGEAYEQYQTALREIFTNIRNGVLQTASESLLNVSEWLLSKVVELGLAGDEEELYEDRIKLWRDFNHAWLGLCQKQKDMFESGAALQRGQSVISEEGLNKMGAEIVRLCNGIERHGLVDYEYGVWEERIIDILEQCADLYRNAAEESSPSQAHSSGQAPSQRATR